MTTDNIKCNADRQQKCFGCCYDYNSAVDPKGCPSCDSYYDLVLSCSEYIMILDSMSILYWYNKYTIATVTTRSELASLAHSFYACMKLRINLLK